jgi:hypothetical protein
MGDPGRIPAARITTIWAREQEQRSRLAQDIALEATGAVHPR